MFDGILGRGFAPKGKSLIKLTKNRIDVLRRKRTATIKFLKKDLADLVSDGLDVNAYNRAGGLLDELRHLWNLDFVDSTGDFVYKNLITMQKMVECPEDCREAVSSLMFAASGFSELPELRELRNMFHEKYADSLRLFVNQELVESMSSKPYSLEKKLKLMEDVAVEFSIHWDSKAFEKRMVRHNCSSAKEIHNNGPPKTTYDKYQHVARNAALSKRKEFDLPSKERLESHNNEVNLNRKKADAPQRIEPLFQPDEEKNQNGLKGNHHGLIPKERSENVRHATRSESKDNDAEGKEFHLLSKKEPSRERHKPHFKEAETSEVNAQHKNLFQGNEHQNGVVDADKKTEVIASEKSKPRSSTKKANKLVIGFKQENFFQGYKHEKYEEKRAESIDLGDGHCDDRENRENTVLVEKSSVTHHSKNTEEDPSGGNIKVEPEVEKLKSSIYKTLPPPYVKPSGKAKNGKPEAATVYSKAPGNSVHDGSFHHGSETAEKVSYPDIEKNVSGIENEAGHQVINDIDKPSQKRRSSRRKHTKQSSGDDISIMDRQTRRENSRKGLQVLIDDDEKDSEEKMMDKLLMHYSRKPSSFEKSNAQQESKSRRSHVRKVKEKEGKCEEMVHRSVSLPSHHHQVAAEPSESSKTFARAASFQPDRSSPAKHVHPKLPDYDDLAARFAELKGR